jgi:protein involved in polysaccharide export with SLBB domain
MRVPLRGPRARRLAVPTPHRWTRRCLIAVVLVGAGACLADVQPFVPASETTTQLVVMTASPPEQTVLHPGDTLSVIVKAAPGVSGSAVFLFADRAYSEANFKAHTVPVTATFTVKPEAVGRLTVTAAAKDAVGALAVPVALSWQVQPRAALESIKIVPVAVTLGSPAIDTSQQLGVYGHYADGMDRRLSGADTGTTYSSSHPAVATVSPNGTIQAHRHGQTVVTVTNGRFSETVPVAVTTDYP